MDNKEALDEFVWQLQKSFNIATLYSKDHPYFCKPLEELEKRSKAVFNFFPEVRMDISPQAVFIDKQKLDKMSWPEIASGIHRRKIKSIIIKNDVSFEDYICFFSAISLRPQELLMAGGINQIIKDQVSGIIVEELDYSQLLKGEGEEIKDIWTYLMREAISEQNNEKILEVAESFKKMLGQFKIQELLNDDQARENIASFLEYLKANRKDRLVPCMQEILKSMISGKDAPGSEKLQKILGFLNDLSGRELADALIDSISDSNQLDSLNLKLFFQLIEERKHKDIASSFYEKIQNKDYLKEAPQVKRRIYDLFAVSDGSSISDIYRTTLSSLFKNVSFENKFNFDRNALQSNYRFMLLELLDVAESGENLNILIEKITHELDNSLNSRDWKFIKCLFDELKKKESELALGKELFEAFFAQIGLFVEDSVWSGEAFPEFSYLVRAIDKSYRGLDFYLEKMLVENCVSSDALRLFFRFFPVALDVFIEKLEKKRDNLEFITHMVESLKPIEFNISSKIYKHIFLFSNEFVKLEIIKAMRELEDVDTEFLGYILSHEDLFLKKEAFSISAKNKTSRAKAIETLLGIANHWGRNNKLIAENLSIIEEAGAKEAIGHIESIAKRRFLWNWALARKARSILRKWNE